MLYWSQICLGHVSEFGIWHWIETATLKILLFIVTSDTILIEHKIFNLEKGTTKVAVSKL